jgi:hypothetical protein
MGQELVIGGYIPGAHGVDAIVVGYYRGQDLIYVAPRTLNAVDGRYASYCTLSWREPPNRGPKDRSVSTRRNDSATALGTVNGAWLSARKPFRRLIDGGENFDQLVGFGQFKAIVDHRFDRSNAEPASRTLELA